MTVAASFQTTPPTPYMWSLVPGTDNIFIYPLIRKSSVLCSNAYIIKSPLFFLVVDPGSDPEQIEDIRRAIMAQRGEQPIPVFIFLTHCHIDHFLAVDLLMDQTFNGEIICHPIAADAIETMNRDITLANMNGSVLPVCRVRDRFFWPDGVTANLEGRPLPIEIRMLEIENGYAIQSYIIPACGNDRIEAFHTPGHSPDGMSYRIGRFICTGDLHLAVTPGIAGRQGWDNNKIAVSLQTVVKIGKRNGITHILPGHGNIMDFDKTIRIFQESSKEALRLNDLALFDRERSMYLSEYAIVLLEEASNIFSIISARLLKISYYLDMLGENESAKSILSAIDSDMLDKTVDEFNSFIMELKGKRGTPVILKAVQFSRKVNKIFEPERISGLFDPCFLRRIKILLSDFVNVVYGVCFVDQETLFDLNDTVEGTIATLRREHVEPYRIFETLDNDQEFIDELTKRIAYTPLFSSTRFSFSPAQEKPYITADRLMFQDILSALLEQLAIAGIEYISLETSRGGNGTVLSVTPGQGSKPFILRESKMLYLQHSMKIAGGIFKKIVSEEKEIYQFIF